MAVAPNVRTSETLLNRRQFADDTRYRKLSSHADLGPPTAPLTFIPIPGPRALSMNHFQHEQPLVLVVDDEPAVLGEVSSALTEAGLSCHCCTSAEAALAKARECAPDLIISDISLGERSGLDLCEQIRQEAALVGVPVMFLSGAQIPDIIRRSHAAGGTYYLRKPFDPDVLVELVNKALWMPHLVGSHLHGRRPTVGSTL
jgi:CheY-like chemotaxis protein